MRETRLQRITDDVMPGLVDQDILTSEAISVKDSWASAQRALSQAVERFATAVAKPKGSIS